MENSWSISFFLKIGIAALLFFLVYQLVYTIPRSDFPNLILHYSAFFLLYLYIVVDEFRFVISKVFSSVLGGYKFSISESLSFFIGLGILLRLVLVFALPNFSDDLYRFIWDGRLINQGINPFDQLPSYYIDNNISIPGINQSLYEQLNSPNYFTIYPPINQAIFAFSTWLAPNSIWGNSVIMKSFLFAFETGSIFLIIQLLKHFQLPAKNVLLYALNPLIIIEITGNLHFEGAMIFFLLLAVWLITVKKKWVLSAIVFALSVASKLLPLMFLPLLVWRIGRKSRSIDFPLAPTKGGKDSEILNRLGGLNNLSTSIKNRLFQKDWLLLNWKKVIAYFSIIGIILILLFSPLINGVFLTNFGDSLNLYFQKFEFNGSFYYLFRWIGFQYKGYNIIATLGPFLAITAFLGILLITLLEQKPTWKTLLQSMLFAICTYLFCSATVHPWYVAMPVVFCVFTRFRFPILWSGLIFLTYINYSYETYFENLWVVGIEYILVGAFLIWELKVTRLS